MELVTAVDSLEDLVDDIALAERARATRALAAARFASSGAYLGDGAITMGSWLTQHARMSPSSASRLLREGRFLEQFPAVAAAALAGTLSAAQIDELRAAVTSPTAWIFDLQQEGVVAALVGLDLTNTKNAVAEWRQKAEALAEMPEPKVKDRSLSLTKAGDDGTHLLRATLDAASAAQLEHALDTARTWNGDEDDRTRGMQNADALDAVISFFNANHDRPGTPRHRPHVTMNVNLSDLDRWRFGPCATVRDGQLIPDWTANTLGCDCVIHRVLRAPGTVLDYGRATRAVPANLYRAVIERDVSCRFCDRPAAWCDVHHIAEWHPFGETKLENLLLLCSHHHRMIHRDRWTVELRADGSVAFTSATGRVIERQPRRHPTTGPPIAA